MTRPSTLPSAPGLLLAALLPVALACGAESRDAVRTCTLPTDCGPGARCLGGACQASTPPTADFTLPATLVTNRLVAITASASDPDPGDSVVSWAWTVTRLSAACDADADVADAATLQAAFWCAGTYEISVSVTDAAGAVSAPVRRTAVVALLDGAPTVAVGPPVAVEHRCAGTPLRCGLAQPVVLTADAQAPLGGPLTYRWAAIPPDAGRAGAAALLSPSANVQSPALSIASDGGALSGSWRLRVRVEDALGNLAQAFQVVAVDNHPPVLDAAPLALDHRYQGGAYRADGPLSVPVSDPDGDPVEVDLALREPADSGCTAALSAATSSGAGLTLSCPSPAGLIASGRALVVTAADVNGATTSAAVPVQVLNRLPLVHPFAGAGLATLELDHTVGPCPAGGGDCFLVEGANPFVAIDPDGDPVTAVTLVAGVEAGHPASTGVALAGAGGGGFRFATPVEAPGEFRSPSGASGFWLTATASDPFGASAPAQPALALLIRNRPPTARLAAGAGAATHRYDVAAASYLASAPLVVVEDPDGDPLDARGSSGDESCGVFSLADGLVSVACARPYAVGLAGYPTLAGFAGAHPLVARVSDGWTTAALPVNVEVANDVPSVESYVGAIESCTCRCPAWEPETPGVCAGAPIWAADPTQVTFPLRPTDADGDPLDVAFRLASGSPTGATLSPSSRTGLPETCTTTLSTSAFPVTVVVTASDGVSQAISSWTATRVTCAKAGEGCTLPVGARRR